MQSCHLKQNPLGPFHRPSLANAREDTHKYRACSLGSLLTPGDPAHTSRSAMDTINSRFSIRKDRNHGVGFQYDAVVRNREERKHMLGSDCECCREVSGDGPRRIPYRLNSPCTSTMKPLGHYRLRDNPSGERRPSGKCLTTSTHQKTTRKIPITSKNINN